jgi:hypothetical protein
MKQLLLILSMFSIVGAVDVKQVSTTTTSTYTNFNQRVAEVGATSYAPFYNNSVLAVSGKLTIPATFKGTLIGNSYFKGVNGSAQDTVYFAGNWNFPNNFIFDTSITVIFAPGAVSEVRPEWWGGYPNDLLDDTRAINSAINSSALFFLSISYPGLNYVNGVTVKLDRGIYRISDAIYVNERGTTIRGEKGKNPNGLGDSMSATQIKYVGAANNSKSVIFIDTLGFSCDIYSVYLNANDSAGYCIYQKGARAPSLNSKGGIFKDITFFGYRKKGWVIGDSTDVSNDAQFENIEASTLKFYGGLPYANTTAIHVNAQNLEFLNITSMYIDPPTIRAHKNHIRQIAGGINIMGMVSTRSGSYGADSAVCPNNICWTDFAIYSQDQLIINGWRSEDRKLVYRAPATVAAPSMISNVTQRQYGYEADTVTGINVIEHNSFNGPFAIVNARLGGSVLCGASSKIYLSATNVLFADDSAIGDRRFKFSGPRNQRGLIHDIDSGTYRILGTYPIFDQVDTAGNSKFTVSNGSIIYQSRTNTTITSNQNDYAIGDGTNRRLVTNGNYNITGMSGGVNGRFLLVTMESAYKITFKHNSSSSISANRINMSDSKDLVLGENEMAIFFHNGGHWKGYKLYNKSFDSVFTTHITSSGDIKFSTTFTNKTSADAGTIDLVLDTGSSTGITMRGKKGGVAYGGTSRMYFLNDGANTSFNINRGGDTTKGLKMDSAGIIKIGTPNESSSSTTGALVVSGGVGVAKSITTGDKITIPSTKFFYLGDSATSGTWRIGRDVDSLKFQRNESGTWINKHTITP